ncbi:MAG: potassium channel family protein, partial [Porticoccaceae bacterium]|nr:potassium channel family protein [Porticoccaceae bacterium]
VFAVEYVTRVWIAGEDPAYRGFGGRLKYMISPYALADLLAFLPEMIVLLAFSQADSAAVAAFKALRLLRLLKLARFVPAFTMLSSAFARCASQLAVALGLALALIYVSAIVLYFIEGAQQPDAFGSIPRATWWAVATLTTVGYGDAYPITSTGKFVAALIALAGIGVVALPAG